MFSSQILLPIEIAIFVIGTSLIGLFFFGRGKNPKPTQSMASTDGNDSQAEETKTSKASQASRIPNSQRLVSKGQLEKSKRELRTLLLEKELVSAALTRLYEAEAAGQITKEERETLSVKYRDELRFLDSKIVGIDAFVEVGDLETLRDQLLQLVNEKIDAIDRRIERTKVVASPLINELLEKKSQKPPSIVPELQAEKKSGVVPDITDMLASKASVTSQTSISSETREGQSQMIAEPVVAPQAERAVSKRGDIKSDGQVEELQKELLEALDRLEKMDLEA